VLTTILLSFQQEVNTNNALDLQNNQAVKAARIVDFAFA